MGLTNALDSSRTNVLVSSQAMEIISNNIANAHVDSYSKKTVSLKSKITNGIGSGVEITSLKSKIDTILQDLLRDNYTLIGASEAAEQFYNRLRIKLGDPNEKNHLAEISNEFFNKISTASNSPDKKSAREHAVVGAQTLAREISSFARDAQIIRYDIDQEINLQVNKINSLLKRIQSLNAASTNIVKGSQQEASLEEEKISTIESLARLININTFTDNRGKINISTTAGLPLLDDNLYYMSYIPASSPNVFSNNDTLSAITLYIIDENDNKIGNETTIIGGGKEGQITSILQGGKLHGLQQLRDIELPKIIDRLDSVAYQFTTEINKLHNRGGGFSAASELVGTTMVKSTSQRDWSGKVRIAIVDPDGNPIKRVAESPSGVQRTLRPLDIDLSKLDYGSGQGKNLTVQNFIDEINEYFLAAPVEGRVRIGNIINNDPTSSGGIEDIRLVSNQTNTNTVGTFDFDFEIDNAHRNNYSFEVINLTIDNGGIVNTTVNTPFNSIAGERQRTKDLGSHRVTFTGGGGDYTITARIKITDTITNKTSVSDISYTINDNATDIMNKRYVAKSATGDDTLLATEGAVMIGPSTVQGFLKADIVDSNGIAVPNGSDGYLSLKSLNPSKYRIVIDDTPIDRNDRNTEERRLFYTSSEKGLSTDASIKASNKGWSHYYGMNNLFVENNTFRNSAYNMKVRSDIVADSDKLSIASLRKNTQPTDVSQIDGVSKAKGSFRLDFPPANGDTLTVNGLVFTFDNSGSTATTIDRSSANINTIIANIVAKLNATESTLSANGVNLSTYSVNNTLSNEMHITFNAAGNHGNRFTISANLSGGSTASINNNASIATPSGSLKGGTEGSVKVTYPAYSFGLARKDKQILEEIIKLKDVKVNFQNTAYFSTTTVSLTNFVSQNVIAYTANVINIAEATREKDEFLFNSYLAEVRSKNGVNIDEELINMLKFQASYNASAKMISTVTKMIDLLIDSF